MKTLNILGTEATNKNLIVGSSIIEKYKINKGVNQKRIFQAASISKILTAICIMKLIEKNKINLKEDVNFYLKNWKVRNSKHQEEKVTIKQLLSHTAGINCSGFRGYSQNQKIPSLFQILDGKKPANNSRIYCKYKKDKYRYSGGGYEILQKVIKDVTKKSFSKFVENNIFKPLNLKNSSFSKPKKKFALGYNNARKIKRSYFTYPEKAAAGLWTTSDDLAKLLIEVQLSYIGKSNKILSKKSVRTMLKPLIPAERNFMSLGFFISKDNKRFYHSGHNVGYRSKFVVDFKGNGIVIMTNNDKGHNFINKFLKRIK